MTRKRSNTLAATSFVHELAVHTYVMIQGISDLGKHLKLEHGQLVHTCTACRD